MLNEKNFKIGKKVTVISKFAETGEIDRLEGILFDYNLTKPQNSLGYVLIFYANTIRAVPFYGNELTVSEIRDSSGLVLYRVNIASIPTTFKQ